MKVHTVIHANEGVPSDIKFTSAATNDSFMLKPTTLSKGDIMSMDRAYIDYGKFEQLTQRGVIYVTKMKMNLNNIVRYDVSDPGRPWRSGYRMWSSQNRRKVERQYTIKHA
ncbi:MAG: transposase [Lepagella sp.]